MTAPLDAGKSRIIRRFIWELQYSDPDIETVTRWQAQHDKPRKGAWWATRVPPQQDKPERPGP